jgi:peptidoglycan LD-endopeptidase CwlK
MIRWGKGSLAVRATLAPPLIALADDVAQFVPPKFDHTLLCGHRNEAAQNKAFADKRSTKRWPDSKHNVFPSLALDVLPYPDDWLDELRIARLIGIYDARAIGLGIAIRVGLDFNGNGRSRDERFIDAWHLELV